MSRHPFSWIPSLYLAEGLPNVIVVTVALVMFKRLGLDNAQSSFYVAWLYLPWVIKPFWSPFVEFFRTKRWWIITMQAIIGASLAGIALSIPTTAFMQWSLVFLWLIAFSSATHDIAADGFYMLELSAHEQALYVGLRNTFYRIANITGQGLLIFLAGRFEVSMELNLCHCCDSFPAYHRLSLVHVAKANRRSSPDSLQQRQWRHLNIRHLLCKAWYHCRPILHATLSFPRSFTYPYQQTFLD